MAVEVSHVGTARREGRARERRFPAALCEIGCFQPVSVSDSHPEVLLVFFKVQVRLFGGQVYTGTVRVPSSGQEPTGKPWMSAGQVSPGRFGIKPYVPKQPGSHFPAGLLAGLQPFLSSRQRTVGCFWWKRP